MKRVLALTGVLVLGLVAGWVPRAESCSDSDPYCADGTKYFEYEKQLADPFLLKETWSGTKPVFETTIDLDGPLKVGDINAEDMISRAELSVTFKDNLDGSGRQETGKVSFNGTSWSAFTLAFNWWGLDSAQFDIFALGQVGGADHQVHLYVQAKDQSEVTNKFYVTGVQITGCYEDNVPNDDSFSPVPEPATVGLLGTGLLGLAALGRRRLRK